MALYKKIKQDFPYDITKEKWMNKIVTMNSYFKVRVYLLACQNLTASDSSVELKSKLAGMQALCSADPYPIIIIGEGDKGATDGKVKSTNDRETALDQTLNPQFFRAYEFDARFPEDWKMEIQIWDKGSISYMDGLIGSAKFDLENRVFGY